MSWMKIYWVIYYFVQETILKWLVDLLLKSVHFSSLCCIIMVIVKKGKCLILNLISIKYILIPYFGFRFLTNIFKALRCSFPEILVFQCYSMSKLLNCTHFQWPKTQMSVTLHSANIFIFIWKMTVWRTNNVKTRNISCIKVAVFSWPLEDCIS